jgi:hypothetical protein
MVTLQGARRFSWLHTSFAGASVRARGPLRQCSRRPRKGRRLPILGSHWRGWRAGRRGWARHAQPWQPLGVRSACFVGITHAQALLQLFQYSVFSNCSSTVTVSSSGPRKLFKGVTTAMSVVIDRFPLLLPVRNSVASYGASTVTRTSDRGYLAEARNQCHRSGGVPIRVSKETFLPLNVHLCGQFEA